MIERLSTEYDLEAQLTEASSTATKFRISNSKVTLGFISSITKPFCSQCNRARLSVDGMIYTCLFANQGFDIKNIIRSDNHEEAFLNFLIKYGLKEMISIHKSDLVKKLNYLRLRCHI